VPRRELDASEKASADFSRQRLVPVIGYLARTAAVRGLEVIALYAAKLS
jgi:hypothetical protein